MRFAAMLGLLLVGMTISAERASAVSAPQDGPDAVPAAAAEAASVDEPAARVYDHPMVPIWLAHGRQPGSYRLSEGPDQTSFTPSALSRANHPPAHLQRPAETAPDGGYVLPPRFQLYRVYRI